MTATLSQPLTRQQAGNPTGDPLTPMRFFEAMHAYQRTAAVKAAIELDLFTAIADTDGTVAAIASRIRASKRGVRALCDFLVVMGFAGKYLDEDSSRYSLTADTNMFLNRKSPVYVGSATTFMGSRILMNAFDDLAAVVRAGGPLPERPRIDSDSPLWVDFARSMAPLLFPIAEKTAGLLKLPPKSRVLDIAAGHGLYGIQVAKQNPDATIVALDFASVLAVASENAERAGVLDRFSFLPGDALEVSMGTGFDAALVTNLLHHWDPPTIEKLLRKVYAALAPGGRIVIVEFVPNADRVSPPMAAAFVMNMLANTTGGDVYTFSEHTAMLGRAGFTRCEEHSLMPFPEVAIVAVKS